MTPTIYVDRYGRKHSEPPRRLTRQEMEKRKQEQIAWASRRKALERQYQTREEDFEDVQNMQVLD